MLEVKVSLQLTSDEKAVFNIKSSFNLHTWQMRSAVAPIFRQDEFQLELSRILLERKSKYNEKIVN